MTAPTPTSRADCPGCSADPWDPREAGLPHTCALARAARPEPPPVHVDDAPSVHDLLCARLGPGPIADDIQARKAFGMAKYGTILQAHNGRNARVDALQEVYDAMVYCEQAAIEGDRDAIMLVDVLAVVAMHLRAKVSGQ